MAAGYVHFLRNALDYVPRNVDDDCLMELRWFYERRDLAEARRDLTAWLGKWQANTPGCAPGRRQHRGTLTFCIHPASAAWAVLSTALRFGQCGADIMHFELQPATASATGTYEELNIFGTRTGRVLRGPRR